MVNENAGQLFSDCLGEQNSTHRRIHATRKSAENFAVSDLFPQLPDRRFRERVHLPVAAAATDIINKVMEEFLSFLCMHDFRMELNSIKLSGRIFCASNRAGCAVRCNMEAFRYLRNIVCMAHPGRCLFVPVA